jgi:7,8-dihydropterin-6-yl-methyl-4-(beta-D-ribofuranosyl)aminobenzene 5'-phosphate synthase
MDIHILSDNTVAESRPTGLVGEWGFSAAVGDVLLDAGQSGVAAENARRLGIDPTGFDDIVLSHGHYDHTAGLEPFLAEEPTVYAHPAAFEPKFKDDTYIGIPTVRPWLESRASLQEHTEPIEVAPNVYALGEIPRQYPDNPVGERVTADGERTEDPIRDDQSIAVETADGVGLVLGCCHAGLRNTVTYAESVLADRVRWIVGGTHLIAADEAGVRDVAGWLEDRLDVLAASHCTGAAAERILAAELGDVFVSVGVGSTVTFGES